MHVIKIKIACVVGEAEEHYLRFVSRSIRNVVIEEVIAHLGAFLSSEREKRGSSAQSPQMMLEKMHVRWLGEAMPTTHQKQKSLQKRSVLRPNGFLPFQEAHSPPIIKANIAGSEDGTENIPPAPAFRPVNGISPKC